jgi:hypothetical protein
VLADAKDLDRLVALAADPARHHRMLDATGGDTAALAEIATALPSSTPNRRPICSTRYGWPGTATNSLTATPRSRLSFQPSGPPSDSPFAPKPLRGQITDPQSQANALADLAKA